MKKDIEPQLLPTEYLHKSTNNSDNALMLVREDISKLKDKIYLHDIIGGIGYIVGIFGLWALIRASKMTRASQSKER